jgi:hypothetical protein
MVTIATVSTLISGDAGGVGICRMRFQRVDATTPTVTDSNTAGAAVKAVWQSLQSYIPTDITVAVQPVVELNAHDSGLVQGSVTMSSIPSAFTGNSAVAYGAGLGVRGDWLTSSIHGRRLIQGSTRFVPLTNAGFTTAGLVSSAVTNALNSAMATYIAATGGGAIEYIVWHRPPKGTFSGGAVGLITGGRAQTTPTGLRSRRS